jgi:hypothetical protein
MASLKFSITAAAEDEVDTQVVSEVDTVAGVEAVLGAISVVVADAVAVETSGVGAAVSAALPVEENRHRVDQHFLQNDQHF